MILYLALIVAFFATPLLAQDTSDLAAAKAKYLQALPASGEAARSGYVRELIRLHNKLMSAQVGKEWTDSAIARSRAIDEEINKFPEPADSDSIALSKLRAGKWKSARHDSIFRSNGTWNMLPIDDANTPHGTWSIKGNQYLDVAVNRGSSWEYTIIFLDTNYFVFTDKQGHVFYEERTSK